MKQGIPSTRRMIGVGVAVRWKPGTGVYGYEDVIEADGRIPAIVTGHTKTRVRIEFVPTKIARTAISRAVDAASLAVS